MQADASVASKKSQSIQRGISITSKEQRSCVPAQRQPVLLLEQRELAELRKQPTRQCAAPVLLLDYHYDHGGCWVAICSHLRLRDQSKAVLFASMLIKMIRPWQERRSFRDLMRGTTRDTGSRCLSWHGHL